MLCGRACLCVCFAEHVHVRVHVKACECVQHIPSIGNNNIVTESIQFFIAAHSKHYVSRYHSLHTQILCCISRKLKHLCTHIEQLELHFIAL